MTAYATKRARRENADRAKARGIRPLSEMTDEERDAFWVRHRQLMQQSEPEPSEADILSEGRENELQSAIERGETVTVPKGRS